MKAFMKAVSIAVILSSGGASFAADQSPKALASVDGRWDATLTRNGIEIPFRLDILGAGPTLKGVLYDGFEPYDGTSSATFEDGKLVLSIEHYLTTITATVKEGQLTGSVVMQSRAQATEYGFRARRYATPAAAAVDAPTIAGSWEIPLDTPSSKGEKAFRFIVRQKGAEVAASILRVDGDTGAYSGTFQDGKWVLSHFDGSRPGVIVVSLTKEGTLEILQRNDRTGQPSVRPGAQTVNAPAASTTSAGSRAYGEEAAPDGRYAATLIAYRPDVARAKGFPEPENYDTHTTVRDPNERFTFNFPDVNNKIVSNEDPRFKGKVVLAIVTGTWCPNCHDEAQYLVQLDRKYRSKGLAIVALDFEEPEQQGTLERERAFVKQYGVNYTYLIAGAPSEMWEKIPQAVNLNTWPATIFVGRDGLVKGIHSGFASPASGEFNRELRQQFTAKIEQLLAEKPSPASAASAAATVDTAALAQAL
jgi:thiol-disulfide isomerase/thioredoxin